MDRERVRFRASGAGHTFEGDAFITNARVSSLGGVEMTIKGTGPLDGFDEDLLQ